jgi:hypothetical protein
MSRHADHSAEIIPAAGARAAGPHGPRRVLSVLLVVPPVTAVTGLLPPQPEAS